MLSSLSATLCGCFLIAVLQCSICAFHPKAFLFTAGKSSFLSAFCCHVSPHQSQLRAAIQPAFNWRWNTAPSIRCQTLISFSSDRLLGHVLFFIHFLIFIFAIRFSGEPDFLSSHLCLFYLSIVTCFLRLWIFNLILTFIECFKSHFARTLLSCHHSFCLVLVSVAPARVDIILSSAFENISYIFGELSSHVLIRCVLAIGAGAAIVITSVQGCSSKLCSHHSSLPSSQRWRVSVRPVWER